MSATDASLARPNFQAPVRWWAIVSLGAVAIAAAFHVGIANLVDAWLSREEYSHGILIPCITAFLIWQRSDVLREIEFSGAWTGVALVLAGLLINSLGLASTVFTLQQHALVIVIFGFSVALLGWRATRVIVMPLCLLFLMVPLPPFLLGALSEKLQLISSQIGVWFVRLAGISVFVEGNVIDLGTYQLQVAEACDGLRYLFPLTTLSFIMAYFYKASLLKRVVVFASAIPITVFMNSFRIGTIGIMVEHWGVPMAEGFLHDFQGWMVFMLSAGVLVLEMILLARVGGDRRSLRALFRVDMPNPAVAGSARRERHAGPPFYAAILAIMAFAAATFAIPSQAHAVPAREQLVAFPMQLERWDGRRSALEQIYLDALKLDDYIVADFIRDQREHVNFYVAWYDSQQAGQSAHSPRSCLPGGGWKITDLREETIPGVSLDEGPLRVNRVQIELGTQRQLVYYWFQQRGRIITNEYLVKWYLFWDSLTRGRSDGALVRLVTPLQVGESPESADRRLAEFAAHATARLNRYVPD